MAARISDVMTLAERHAREVCRNPDSWMNYLDAAARFYRYPFQDTFLIHAQRPDATVCAAMSEWNHFTGRWVNRGARGIALVDDTQNQPRLRYVFDVSDTRPTEKSRKMKMWHINKKNVETVKRHLIDTYDLASSVRAPLPKILQELARILTSEHIRENIYDLTAHRSGTYLSDMDEKTLLRHYSNLIEQSTAYVLMKRCQCHPEEHLNVGEFAMISEFDDIRVLPFLGQAVHDVTEQVLLGIGSVVRDFEREEAKKAAEKAPIDGQVTFIQNDKLISYELTKEQKDFIAKHTANETEAKRYEETYRKYGTIDLSELRGLSVSDVDDERGKTGQAQNQSDADRADQTPENEKSSAVRDPAVDGRDAEYSEIKSAPLVLPVLPSPEEQKETIEKVTAKEQAVEKEKAEKEKEPEKPPKKQTRKRTTSKTAEKTAEKAGKAADKPEEKKTTRKRTSVKSKLEEKQKEADKLNAEHATTKTRSRAKSAAL